MKPLRLGLALTLLLAVAPTTSASTASAPEREIMSLVNRARADAGLVPLRSDYRLWVLADDRAAAMASSDILSHATGGSLQATLDGRAIHWFGFGEVIAWTSASPASSAQSLYGLWASSAPHWKLLMSSSFNYLGVGLSYSASGRTYGSIVLTESKDRTAARATVVSASVSGNDVQWSWRGGDTALQTHTAGLRDYAVQMRVDGGGWSNVTSATSSTSRTLANRAGGHWYGLRVRARDRAGNVGAWSPERRVWVP